MFLKTCNLKGDRKKQSFFVDLIFEDFMLNPADSNLSYDILHYSFLKRPGNVLTLQKRRLIYRNFSGN